MSDFCELWQICVNYRRCLQLISQASLLCQLTNPGLIDSCLSHSDLSKGCGHFIGPDMEGAWRADQWERSAVSVSRLIKYGAGWGVCSVPHGPARGSLLSRPLPLRSSHTCAVPVALGGGIVRSDRRWQSRVVVIRTATVSVFPSRFLGRFLARPSPDGGSQPSQRMFQKDYLLCKAAAYCSQDLPPWRFLLAFSGVRVRNKGVWSWGDLCHICCFKSWRLFQKGCFIPLSLISLPNPKIFLLLLHLCFLPALLMYNVISHSPATVYYVIFKLLSLVLPLAFHCGLHWVGTALLLPFCLLIRCVTLLISFWWIETVFWKYS